jgi:heme oxygenase
MISPISGHIPSQEVFQTDELPSDIIHPQTSPTEYTENINAKAHEIENIRKALHLSQDKLLWEVLDKGRQASHIKVRQNHFLQQLTTGRFCQTAFMRYLVNLFHLHQALEEAQKTLMDIEYLRPFIHKELFRSVSIQRDLKIWEFVSAPEFVPWHPCKITLDYAEYIKETALKDPERIIAIMYTLYGTIMSGGQTNKKIVHQSLENIRTYIDDIPGGSGVTLYEIGTLDNVEIAKFKIKWHESLCRVQAMRPALTSIEEFHLKLTQEVTKTFETILEIIKIDVEQGHC